MLCDIIFIYCCVILYLYIQSCLFVFIIYTYKLDKLSWNSTEMTPLPSTETNSGCYKL